MSGLKLSLRAVEAMAGVLCGLLLVIRLQSGPFNVILVLLLVPLFFVGVSVLSYLFGEGFYYWNKSRAGFERYDSGGHPVRAFLYFAFFAVAAGFFVTVLFKL